MKRKAIFMTEQIDKFKKQKISNITYFNKKISNIDDLIFLANQYRPGMIYNINLEKIFKLLPTLLKLKNVIGMASVKTQIVNQIIYYIQDFQDVNTDMLHTVIQGPPGVGKTMLGEIISEIYFTLDIIQQPTNKQNETNTDTSDCCNNFPTYNLLQQSDLKFKKVKIIKAKRSDLIGKYLGQTAIKTQEVINKSLGGVLFIDEAYSLGNSEQKDSYSKECIDTINQNLTEKKNQLLVIIAGYKHSLDTCFFAYNDGLKRRFPFVYTIDTYSPFELGQIFKKMIGEIDQIKKWSVSVFITDTELEKFFKTNSKYFSNSAGDIETFVFNVKIEHAKRVFPCPFNSKVRRQITKDDLNASFIIYKSNKIIPKDNSELFSHIYI